MNDIYGLHDYNLCFEYLVNTAREMPFPPTPSPTKDASEL